MPEFIDHVPSQSELEKWSAERTATQAVQTPEISRLDTHLIQIHRQQVALNTSGRAIYDPSDIGLPSNGEYSVIGELQMGADESVGTVAIIRQTNEGGTSFLLAGLEKDAGDKNGGLKASGILTLREGFPVELGRLPTNTTTPENLGFAMNLNLARDKHISKSHAFVRLDKGKIFVQDRSSNGSLVRANGEMKRIDTHISHHTARADEVARLRGYLQEIQGGERVNGRRRIDGNTVIDGADSFIDIRSWVGGAESIVVDSQKYSKEFDKLRNTFNEVYAENLEDNLEGEAAVLKSIFDTVLKTLQYDLDFVDKLSANNTSDMKKIALNYYLDEGKGVCRHMALAAAWMGGELMRAGLLKGKMTAEGNQRLVDNAAHAWARYTAEDGTVYIIDPAQQYLGRLEDSLKRHESWEYFHQDERLKYEMLEQQRAAQLGRVVLPSLSQRINEQ